MVVYNYFCTHEDCESKENIKIQKEEAHKDMEEKCQVCGKPMKRIGLVPSGGHAKFSSMSPEDKRKTLTKRSDAHFQKHGRHEKQYRQEKAIQKLHETYTGGQKIK